MDPLVVVADDVHAAVQIFAFRDHFCSAVYSTHKGRSLQGEHKHVMQRPGEREHIRVSSHAHWCILATLELKFVSEFHCEKLIYMIESLGKKMRNPVES